MARPEEDPVEKIEEGVGHREDRTYTHPAFGQISIVKTSGQANLYGSDFVHHNYVSIRISESQLRRGLARDWHYSRNVPYIEIAMSEAQWATFVSSFSVGGGVPCTIQARDGKMVPGIPYRDSGQEYKRETDEHLKKVLDTLTDLEKTFAEGSSGLSKKKQEELLAPLRSAIRTVHGSVPYIANSFSEFMEKRVEKAKVEVNAYMHSTIVSAGLKAITEQPGYQPPLELGYSDPPKEDGE